MDLGSLPSSSHWLFQRTEGINRRRVTRCAVDKVVKTVSKKSCAEVIGIKMGIKRAKTMKRDQERKKGFRVDRCLNLHGTVWRT
jgi:hypothetical protein